MGGGVILDVSVGGLRGFLFGVNMTRKQTKKWTMKDGRKIRICDMNDSHIENAIKMCERIAHLTRASEIANFPFGLHFQGEMAEYDFELGCENLLSSSEEDFLPDIYLNLIDEQIRRNNAREKVLHRRSSAS